MVNWLVVNHWPRLILAQTVYLCWLFYLQWFDENIFFYFWPPYNHNKQNDCLCNILSWALFLCCTVSAKNLLNFGKKSGEILKVEFKGKSRTCFTYRASGSMRSFTERLLISTCCQCTSTHNSGWTLRCFKKTWIRVYFTQAVVFFHHNVLNIACIRC